MAKKRFTDADKWKKQTFSDMSMKMKLVWLYLLDDCDHAGIWEVNLKLLSFMIGEEIKRDELCDTFGDLIVWLNVDTLFIPSFIEFQYNCTVDELNPANKVHASVIQMLKKQGASKGLARGLLGASKGLGNSPEGACSMLQGASSSSQGAKDKDKDKEQDKDQERDKEKETSKKPIRTELHRIAVLWNEYCGPLPMVKEMNDSRIKRCKLHNDRTDEEIIGAISSLCSNPWNCGKNDRGWKADFDYFIRPEVMTKAVEGIFENFKSKPNGSFRVVER